MSTPDRPDPISANPEASVPPPRRSSMLWLLLVLLALVLIGWYWLGNRQAQAPLVAPPAEVPVTVEPVTPAPAPDRPVAPARKPAAAAPARAGSSPAEPLAGYSAAPQYPVAALRVKEGGTVVLRVNVGTDGLPGEISYARRSGSRELDDAARDAVSQWRFAPAVSKGKPVASVVEIPIDFKPPR